MRATLAFALLGLLLTPVSARAQEAGNEANPNLRIETQFNYDVDFKKLDEDIRNYRRTEAAINYIHRQTEERNEQEQRSRESLRALQEWSHANRERNERELMVKVPLLALKVLALLALVVGLLCKGISKVFGWFRPTDSIQP